MQYATAEMILQAIEDLLEGPHHMHRDILTKVGELRTLREQSDDSRYEPKLRAYPPVRDTSPRRRRLPSAPGSRRAAATLALREIPRHFRPVPGRATDNPQGALLHADQKWWRLAQFDSVLVSSADGSGAAWLRRDPERFRSILWRCTFLHARLAREWDRLASTYRQVVPQQAGPDAWADTFARSEATTTHSKSQTQRDARR
jgi:galactofuranosylgalactofuranosylrhamnosyl-N-acetylglucosaminyl-diphospho-decaprenol beta-1,5/1,6-galactofuranosyltransferase